ncbi:hypothetical protein [Saccharothrix australiensis]|uniref:Tetratricopeptide repeat protein n=1 Tax=Saccharothrix australiensis TaxID=2072 RepID=A0A495W723_9PSEU|nr:hypothetical protein [Saccharothrix australiensis]RKT56615.1 hypothetical protein C8E97_5319 [Saccharothrix australiensis]
MSADGVEESAVEAVDTAGSVTSRDYDAGIGRVEPVDAVAERVPADLDESEEVEPAGAGSADDGDADASGVESDDDETRAEAAEADEAAEGSGGDVEGVRADRDAGDRRGDRRDDRRDDNGESTRARAPELPEDADISILDPEVKQELRGLPKGLAEIVGRHLAAAGILIDGEPELALEHARYARTKAARVGVVREAAGLTAYHAGEWAEALSELRAARRMTHGAGHVAVMADCERALGRPERAIELAREAQSLHLAPEEAVELRIVAAGARRDMGQLDAAVVALQGADLDAKRRDPWSARLFYAYADNLAAAGRTEEAVQWFLNAAQADDDNETDAAERAFDLSPQE